MKSTQKMNKLINLALKIFRLKLVTVGIPVIIKNKKGKILLGKRNNKVVTFPNMWGLPGGMMDYGESPESAARREIKE